MPHKAISLQHVVGAWLVLFIITAQVRATLLTYVIWAKLGICWRVDSSDRLVCGEPSSAMEDLAFATPSRFVSSKLRQR